VSADFYVFSFCLPNFKRHIAWILRRCFALEGRAYVVPRVRNFRVIVGDGDFLRGINDVASFNSSHRHFARNLRHNFGIFLRHLPVRGEGSCAIRSHYSRGATVGEMAGLSALVANVAATSAAARGWLPSASTAPCIASASTTPGTAAGCASAISIIRRSGCRSGDHLIRLWQINVQVPSDCHVAQNTSGDWISEKRRDGVRWKGHSDHFHVAGRTLRMRIILVPGQCHVLTSLW
jgi:hypothetical protein